jgi:hypothetical protein
MQELTSHVLQTRENINPGIFDLVANTHALDNHAAHFLARTFSPALPLSYLHCQQA